MADIVQDSMQEISSLHIEDEEEFNYNSRRLIGNLQSTIDPFLRNESKMLSVEYLGNLFDVVSTHTESSIKGGIFELGVKSNGATLVMNASLNTTEPAFIPELFYRHSMAMTIVYCVAYFCVFAVGLVGNFFVIAVVFRSPRMRTVTNFFIVNLAVADILVIVFCLPATLMSNIFVPWVLGWWMCKIVPYIQGVSVAASVYSLIAVSLDR